LVAAAEGVPLLVDRVIQTLRDEANARFARLEEEQASESMRLEQCISVAVQNERESVDVRVAALTAEVEQLKKKVRRGSYFALFILAAILPVLVYLYYVLTKR
jgi:anti-sigma28 factor (negative regulator of flagellin synthesis)